ncbi:hypothetical protein HF673_01230 [Acidithiobacillus thiooxidans]|uniref:Uncharacterized protein n=2 Tax=Acidithiobacillus thiooxidans TaxID=930 RepID=A0A1C2I949_ACITH|nr:hypothetical protein [Acidithiobacillus thiooxidans]MBU2834438.1 hypothetical protein [Acidithiobacillus thiooxidans]OCX72515.1 hypothetical protein A6M23_09745 [Acidithiobacillus thiooxidans]OCX83499.1 hypothetical protein A6P08_10390 [Acidithiobacillus thiooxidans]QFX96697.1 hypothetical protein GCD22_02509 [Acidithiobacillus thiooxidans ATCC 19377]
MSNIGASIASLLKKRSARTDDTQRPSVEAEIPQTQKGVGKRKPVIWVLVALGIVAVLGTAYVAMERKVDIPFRADVPMLQAATNTVRPTVPSDPENVPVHTDSPAIPHTVTTPTVPKPELTGNAAHRVAPDVVVPNNRVTQISPDASATPGISATTGKSSAPDSEIRKLKAELTALKSEMATVKAAAVKAAAEKPRVVYRTIVQTVPAAPAKPAQVAPAPVRTKPLVQVLGAANGIAWVSIHGQTEQVRPGDSLPGIGIVQSVSPSGEIHGSNGTLH